MSNNIQNIAWPGWETIQIIGQGAFGTVYEIQREILGNTEKAALKVISIPQNNTDIDELYSDGYDIQSITNMFQNHLKHMIAEYSLMRKMNGSGNIVNCDDIRYVQHTDGIGWDIFIKMELLTPLTDILPIVPAEKTVIKIAKDMCMALTLCKKYDIVHRDIKPQNIFISPNGDYKLGDFGVAKTVEKTMSGTKIGTYRYMAPEIYNNQPYGSSADIYSLGLSLYWMLNERRLPFLPLPPTQLDVHIDEDARIRRLSGEPLPAPAHGSQKLADIILKACAYNANDRYSTPNEMLQDLNQLDCPEIEPPVSLTAGTDDVQNPTLKVRNTPSIQLSNSETASVSSPKARKKSCKFFFLIPLLIIFLIASILFQKNFFFKETATEKSVAYIYGDNALDTSIKVADSLKDIWKTEKFETLILVDENGTSAAFNAGYLAYVRNAPILVINQDYLTDVISYIKSNLAQDGILYLLGSTNAIADDIKSILPDYHIVLLYGENRYDTNAAILEEAGIFKEELLVCSNENYSIGISASATKNPVLLVGKTLSENQKNLLAKNSCKLILLGNDSDFSSELISELELYDTTLEYIEGENVYDISTNIAKRFFDDPDSVVLAYDANDAGSLCGAPLAIANNAPLIFINDDNLHYIIDYVNKNGIESGTFLVHPNLIEQDTPNSIFSSK